jgi:pimeloyl-ACP methyl ester carboxylesterase
MKPAEPGGHHLHQRQGAQPKSSATPASTRALGEKWWRRQGIGARHAMPEREWSWDRFGEVTIPVFVGFGNEDVVIPTMNRLAMQQRLRDARLKVWPESGYTGSRLVRG